jgi:hypothetical protein
LFRMPPKGKTVIPRIILFGRLWRGRPWRPALRRRVRGTPVMPASSILAVERGERPGRHPLPCPPPISACSPLSFSSSYPPQNPSRRPAAGPPPLASSCQARVQATRSAHGGFDSIRHRAAPMRCSCRDQGLLIYASPTLSAAATATRGSRCPAACAGGGDGSGDHRDRTRWPSSSRWRLCCPVGGRRRRPPLP